MCRILVLDYRHRNIPSTTTVCLSRILRDAQVATYLPVVVAATQENTSKRREWPGCSLHLPCQDRSGRERDAVRCLRSWFHLAKPKGASVGRDKLN